MTKIIRKKICDICNKEVENFFAGSLEFKYNDSDHTKHCSPVILEIEDICIDCCRKLDKAITEIIKTPKE